MLGAGEHALGYSRVTYTDVAMARNINCICDGHDLPFEDAVMGAYDFSRFTYLGHRRLFRQFDDVQSGMCGGPGCAAVQLTCNLLGACNAACACDVLGRKHSTTNPDREILAMFRGR